MAILVVAVLISALALYSASGIRMKPDLGELLPRDTASVEVAEAINARLPALSTLAIVAEGPDPETLRRFVDALAPRLETIDPELLGRVDAGIGGAKQFFERRKILYAPLDKLEEAHESILDRYDYEVGKVTELNLLDEEPPPPLTEASLRKTLGYDVDEERDGSAADAVVGASGSSADEYYIDTENNRAAILVRTPISSGDLVRSKALQQAVRERIDEVKPEFPEDFVVGLGGNLITSHEAYERTVTDLWHVGVGGIVFILSAVFLYYLRLRAILAMTIVVGIGATWTFGLVPFLVGDLNQATGFSFSIVVGNGINYSIIYMARYLEERKTRPLADSLLEAHRHTWLATLAASIAAAGAYGSLAITQFRGFVHFGIVGALGIFLCWVASTLCLPPLLVLYERFRPILTGPSRWERVRASYGKPFAFVAGRFPGVTVLIATCFTIGTAGLAYRYIADNPIEYALSNLDNDPVEFESESRRLGRAVDHIVGRDRMDGLAIATDTLDQVGPLKAELERRRDQAPEGRKPFERVVTVEAILPEDQAEKIELLEEARDRIERGHVKGFVADADYERLVDLVPDEAMEEITIASLPEPAARPFIEKDGSRGKLVYLLPTKGRSIWDARYLLEWAASFREVQLPDGSIVRGSGRTVIVADIIETVGLEAPKAITLSLVLTFAVVLIAFRGRREGFWVLGTIIVGLVWLLGVLAVWNSHWSADGFIIEPLKLNFLNFIALPITIGLGADYAVNIMHRYRQSRGDMGKSLRHTGGAVVLCSLTTMIGYGALTLSQNGAVRSFGEAAAVGEICCVLAAVLFLPAIFLRRQKHNQARSTPAS